MGRLSFSHNAQVAVREHDLCLERLECPPDRGGLQAVSIRHVRGAALCVATRRPRRAAHRSAHGEMTVSLPFVDNLFLEIAANAPRFCHVSLRIPRKTARA